MTRAFLSPRLARALLRKHGRRDIAVPSKMDGRRVELCSVTIERNFRPIYSQPHERFGDLVLPVGEPKLVGAEPEPEVVTGTFRGRGFEVDALWDGKCWRQRSVSLWDPDAPAVAIFDGGLK